MQTKSDQQAVKVRLREVFNRLAAPSADYARRIARSEIRHDAAWIKPQPTDVLLDLACGPARLASELARRARMVLGVDLAERMVRHACAKAPANAQFAVGDAESLPCGDATFTLVTWSYSLANFSHPAHLLAEVRRVLRPAGRLAVIEVVASENATQRAWLERLEQARSPRLPTHILTLSEMQSLFQEAGLKLLDCQVQARQRRLRDWLALSPCTNTERRALRDLFLVAAREDAAGLRAYRRAGEWFFYHTVARWLWRR